MMNKFLPFFLLFCLQSSVSRLFSQNNTSSLISWSVPFRHSKSFIENKGQFNDRYNSSPSEILYSIDQGASQIYFNKEGLTYLFEQKSQPKIFYTRDAINMTWENANPDVLVFAEEKTDGYHSYSFHENGEIGNINKIYGYKKLVYKNLYQNIDVEYVFHPETGIKYSLILHAGADISNVKMKYSSSENVSLNETGEIRVTTKFGDIIEHAPTTFYADNHSEIIPSQFEINDNIVSFSLGNYDHSKRIVIDPWTITPAFPNSNKVWEVATDFSGNVYLYGGDNPMTLKKYNSSGVFQWTYTTPWDTSSYWVGTLITDSAGNSYITAGSVAAITKIDSSGAMVWTASGGSNDEYWHMAFNCDQTQLVVGGTRLIFEGGFNVAGSGMAFTINTNNGSVTDTLTVSRITHDTVPFPMNFPNEIRSVCHSPNGNYYFLTHDTIGSFSQSFSLNFRTASDYYFAYNGPSYGIPGISHGFSAICATKNFIYTHDGVTIHKRNISNGAIISSASIPGGDTTVTYGRSAPGNSGLDIDTCGNVFVGSGNQVVQFDADLNSITGIPTPSAVYDVAINSNGEVIACGNGFAMSLNMSACASIAAAGCDTSASPCSSLNLSVSSVGTSCGSANGSASVTVSGGTSPYTYLWNNGQTAQTASGLSPGNYFVTVSDDAGCAVADSGTVVSSSSTMTASASANNTSCGNNNGTATVTASGVSPYSYLWSNNGAAQTVTGLSPGTYFVTVTDDSSCSAIASATISGSQELLATISSTPDSGSNNGTAFAYVTSGTPPFSYQWSDPDSQLTPTVTGLIAGIYYVTITDSANCMVIDSVQVPLFISIQSLTADSRAPVFIFPNPAKNEINVLIKEGNISSIRISVFDVAGKEVAKVKKNPRSGKRELAVDISAFSPGLYFISVTGGNISFKTQFIKE